MQLTYQDILELVCSIFRSYITFLFSQSLCSQDYTGKPLDLHGKTHSWSQILPRFSAQLDSQWLDLNEKNTIHNGRQEKHLNSYSTSLLVNYESLRLKSLCSSIRNIFSSYKFQ